VLCLLHSTDPRWATTAVASLPELLADHAHCEMKAASNALSLATRWPASTRLAGALALIAEEELRHFRAVVEELDRRGIPLGKPEVDVYVAELRKASNISGKQTPEASLIDRLLVASLIEARSCERFRLLADALAARDHELAPFYDDLFVCEARHYTTMVELAIEASGGDEDPVRARLSVLARQESEIAARLGVRPLIHG
jgi:tRNA-(ms[2]io[6]A)-hydroxylase